MTHAGVKMFKEAENRKVIEQMPRNTTGCAPICVCAPEANSASKWSAPALAADKGRICSAGGWLDDSSAQETSPQLDRLDPLLSLIRFQTDKMDA
jgi:hypothetical protein